MVEPSDDAPTTAAPRRRIPPILTTGFRKTAIGVIIAVVATAVLVQTAVCYLFVRGPQRDGKVTGARHRRGTRGTGSIRGGL